MKAVVRIFGLKMEECIGVGKNTTAIKNDLRIGILVKSATHSHLSPVDLEHHLENSSKIVY
jgi:hypothetical protein